MKTVQIHELKAHLAALVDEAARGERIVIARHHRPVAALTGLNSHGVHEGERFGRGALVPMEGVTLSRPIADALADDRSDER